jgi:hypothetical protein
MYILVVGNPVDGVRFYGPFTTTEQASYYAATTFEESDQDNTDWWIAALATPVIQEGSVE